MPLRIDTNRRYFFAFDTLTLSFCQSNQEKALEYFSESLKLGDDHLLSNEMIGMVHYFNENYKASYEYRKKALISLDDYGMHHVHGAIAESAEKLHMHDEAEKYYRQAKRIIERDMLRGNMTPTDEAIGLFYEVKLRLLNGEKLNFESDPLKQKIDELTGFSDNLESSAMIRLALIHYYFGQINQAQKLLNSASQRCPRISQPSRFKVPFAKNNIVRVR